MFHWICPECGREISPQAKECAACEPSTAGAPAVEEPAQATINPAAKSEAKAEPKPEAKPEPLLLAAPAEPAVAPLQPRVAGSPKPPTSAIPRPISPAGRDLSPVEAKLALAQRPSWNRALPDPAPARAPRIASAPLREPQPAAPRTISLSQVTAGPELAVPATTLPALTQPEVAAPPMAGPVDYAKLAASRMRPSAGRTKAPSTPPQEQLSLPGPTLPHELTSLNAAGIAKILVPVGGVAVARRSSWAVSIMVASAVFAGTLGAAFYAMPGLANTSAPKESLPKQAKAEVEPVKPAPTDPLARVVEVTGIRFVTDLPGRPPQIHYLVVNHSNVPLLGVTVNVTLRVSGAEAPLSQFNFRAPKLGPYESKEMVSSIERFNRPVALPDWRELQADVSLAQ